MPRADTADLPAIRQLLSIQGLPVADLQAPSADVRFLVVREGEHLVGAVGLQQVGDRGVLRSLVVSPTHRGQGHGRRLVAEAERTALQAGIGELVLLTETAAPFFEHLGYTRIERAALPRALLETSSFASLCPDTAACLSKSLALAIYHNPGCGTSRNVLAILRDASLTPRVVEYLRTPPDRATLIGLLARMNLTPRELLRQKGTPYAELGLDDASLTDDALIDHMLETPILINRPIVVAPWGTRLCRPSETAREFLLLD